MDNREHDATALLKGWADRLQATARIGLFFANNDYDRERYEQIITIADYFPDDGLPEIQGHHVQAIADAFAAWNGGSPAAAFDRE